MCCTKSKIWWSLTTLQNWFINWRRVVSFIYQQSAWSWLFCYLYKFSKYDWSSYCLVSGLSDEDDLIGWPVKLYKLQVTSMEKPTYKVHGVIKANILNIKVTNSKFYKLQCWKDLNYVFSTYHPEPKNSTAPQLLVFLLRNMNKDTKPIVVTRNFWWSLYLCWPLFGSQGHNVHIPYQNSP